MQPNPDGRLERIGLRFQLRPNKAEIPFYRENFKSQITNPKQITITEIQNPKHAQNIEERTIKHLNSMDQNTEKGFEFSPCSLPYALCLIPLRPAPL